LQAQGMDVAGHGQEPIQRGRALYARPCLRAHRSRPSPKIGREEPEKREREPRDTLPSLVNRRRWRADACSASALPHHVSASGYFKRLRVAPLREDGGSGAPEAWLHAGVAVYGRSHRARAAFLAI